MAGNRYFTRKTFSFLKELAENNDRDWFAANKPRYEDDVKAPSLAVIEAFAPHLAKLSPHFHAGPRSLFRIYRDVRFSQDKRPYKTHTGIHFRHDQAKDVHAPGYYFHIEPGSAFVALGIWHPDSKTLRTIRERIVEEPAAWRKASRGKKFGETFEVHGDSLKRAPKGFDPEHPLIDDLIRKDFIAVREVPQKFVTAADLPKQLAAVWKVGTPFMRFLCEAVEVPF